MFSISSGSITDFILATEARQREKDTDVKEKLEHNNADAHFRKITNKVKCGDLNLPKVPGSK